MRPRRRRGNGTPRTVAQRLLKQTNHKRSTAPSTNASVQPIEQVDREPHVHQLAIHVASVKTRPDVKTTPFESGISGGRGKYISVSRGIDPRPSPYGARRRAVSGLAGGPVCTSSSARVHDSHPSWLALRKGKRLCVCASSTHRAGDRVRFRRRCRMEAVGRPSVRRCCRY
jgi:hypothetical protein